jgi:hypothetical protein
MGFGLRAVVVVLACAAGMALLPSAAVGGRSQGHPTAAAFAQARPAGAHHGGGFPHFASRPFPGGPRRVGPQRFVRRAVPAGASAAAFVYAPPLVYGSAPQYDPFAYDAMAAYAPPVSYAPPPSYAPPVGYAPPVAYAPSPAGAVTLAPPPSPPTPPTPDVVEFPTGRYELRGDGITTPLTWVWVPAPPSEPPPGEPSRHQLYRWTDPDGVAHWTDRLDGIPERYRAEAQQPRLR